MKFLNFLLKAFICGAVVYEGHRLVDELTGANVSVRSYVIGPEDLDFELDPEDASQFDSFREQIENDLRRLSGEEPEGDA